MFKVTNEYHILQKLRGMLKCARQITISSCYEAKLLVRRGKWPIKSIHLSDSTVYFSLIYYVAHSRDSVSIQWAHEWMLVVVASWKLKVTDLESTWAWQNLGITLAQLPHFKMRNPKPRKMKQPAQSPEASYDSARTTKKQRGCQNKQI